ncbi:MAG TPA: flippase-like domain-containing protein [Anaerolineae bacterium]|nr:flippase-like domain-containing protein [Anaerolineae bacterium]
MGNRTRKARNWILGAAISLTALVIALWGVRPARFLDALQQANYLFLIPSALLLALGLLTRARSWHVLLGGAVSYPRTFDALNEGYLLNNVLPLRLGELARAYLVSQQGAISASGALATIVVERLIDIVVSLAGLLGVLPFIVSPDWAVNVAVGVSIALVCVIAGLAVLLYKRELFLNLLRRLPGRGLWGLTEAADRFLNEIGSMTAHPWRLVQAAFWSSLAWLTNWLMIWLLLAAFGEWASPVVPFFSSAVMAFGAALPSSPGAIGVYELSAVAALLVFGYTREVALGVAILAHGLVLGLPGALGAWALAREGQTLRDLASKAQSLLRRTETNPTP